MSHLSTNAAGLCARRLCVLVALLLSLPLVPAADSGHSIIARLASKSLLLDIARAGDHLVAVGDRGHVLLSADKGLTWTQSQVPTQATLTGVSFPDTQHGWAVGHDGVILSTNDGGKTWARQDSGKDIEAIYLDTLFLDAKNGFAVGAYGKFMVTHDGGATWTAGKPTDEEAHFNRIVAAPGGTLYLCGESGLLLVSRDTGATWSRLGVPYNGSLFGIVPLGPESLVVCGLRGHVFATADSGATWEEHEGAVKVLIMAGTAMPDGTLVFAGQGGNFFISRDGARSFTHWKPADFGTSIADLVPAEAGWIVTVGEAGAVRIKLP